MHGKESAPDLVKRTVRELSKTGQPLSFIFPKPRWSSILIMNGDFFINKSKL